MGTLLMVNTQASYLFIFAIGVCLKIIMAMLLETQERNCLKNAFILSKKLRHIGVVLSSNFRCFFWEIF